ncbi:MAG: glycoside transferase family 32 [Tannerellaceae bacterium]|nr:glycoside transferase family 32 [Tannerellaceae bacterium]
MQLIPKIIHQTWKTVPLSLPFSALANTWKTFLPDWEYILWTDEMNRELIAGDFPEFLEAYDQYPRNVQRADAIRYFILKKYGGLYVDIDFECLESVEPLLMNAQFVAGKEPAAHAQRFEKEYIICNAFMASIPESDFIRFVCDKVKERSSYSINSQTDVLTTTGPFFIDRCV